MLCYMSSYYVYSCLDDTNADHSLTDAITHLIWSFGQIYPDYKHTPASGIEANTAKNHMFYKPDEIKYHGSVNRGATTLNFFGNLRFETQCLLYIFCINIHTCLILAR